MSDLTDLSSVSGTDLTETQILGILAQIDLDITNLLRDGKLSAMPYTIGGAAPRSADRAANLQALLDARMHYRKLLLGLPSQEVSRYVDE